MSLLSEGARQGDIIRWELERNISRESVMVYAGSTLTLKRGQVLAIKTADGKMQPSVDGASDGTQNAVAILIDDLATGTGGAMAVVLRRFGIIVQADLVWDSSYSTQGKKDTAIAYLKANSFIAAVPSANYI